MKKICPRCAQGELLAAMIKALSVKVIVCDECEALWTDPENVESSNFQDMVQFLKAAGIEGAWSALEIEEGGGGG